MILHVLPMDLARGAQVYADVLVKELDRPRAPHRLATLYAAPRAVLSPDFELAIPMGLPRRAGFDPRVAIRLAALLRTLQPVAVVAHGSEPLKYILATRHEVPLAAYRIGLSELNPGWRERLFARQLQAADVVAGVSQEVLDESVERFGVAPERCELVPNGRDPDIYRPGASPAVPHLLFIGHFDENKRPGLFLDTVRQVREHMPCTASMVGEGPLLETLRERAAAEDVALLGRRSDVPELLRQASVLISTSRSEGLPGVFVEAALTGVPIITTPVAGAHAVIRDGITGHIVPDDPKQLAAPIVELLRSPAARAAAGAGARAFATERFSMAASARRWSEVLASLAENHTPTTPDTPATPGGHSLGMR